MKRTPSPAGAVALCVCASFGVAGCADVVVFGRTVHEASPSAKAAEPALPAAATTTPSEAAAPPGNGAAARTGRTVRALTLDGPVAAGVDGAALLDELRATLRKRGVLVADAAAPTASVTIDRFEAHATSNAIVLGHRPGAGSLSGHVQVADGTGAALRRFDVTASATLRAPAADPTSFVLKPLYEDLAARIAGELAAVR